MSYKKVLITSINPSSYCESYKRVLIASNNPIQLTDPTKFVTVTQGGVSFISSDGVITANGTAANDVWFNTMPGTQFPLQIGHKMLLTGCPSGGSVSRYLMRLADSNDDMGNGKIFSANNSILTLRIYIRTGYTATNLQFKPQLFDLTQMFGEGNEPTTIAEFRAKFPNEIYPYNINPSYCSSPQSALITPTKNLFNPASANIIDHTTYFTPTGGAGTHFYKMAVESGATYSVSYDLYTNGALPNGLALGVQTGDHYGDGTRLTVNLRGKESAIEFYPHTAKFTVPAGVTQVTFSGLGDNQYRNFQIEKGATVTSYVPYNYI